MTFKTWLLFLVMETALSLSPGPAVFYVVSQGVRGALRRTFAMGSRNRNGPKDRTSSSSTACGKCMIGPDIATAA